MWKREIGEGRKEDNARGGKKQREIERGVSGSLSRNDDAPSPFLSRPILPMLPLPPLSLSFSYTRMSVTSRWFFCAKPSPPSPHLGWRIFSPYGGRVSFFERGALGPLRTSGPSYVYAYVCACTSRHTRSPLPFAASLVRSFVRTYVRSVGPEESMEGQQRQGKKTGRGRDLPHREAHLFWSRNFSRVPSAVTVTDIVFLSR